jgi:hypothetical protein
VLVKSRKEEVDIAVNKDNIKSTVDERKGCCFIYSVLGQVGKKYN